MTKEPTSPARAQPSVDDETAASLRVLAIQLLLRKHGGDPTTWPAEAREQYELMLRQQEEYERTFGRR